MKFKIILLFIFLAVAHSISCIAQEVSLKSLLTEMTDFESIARWNKHPYTLKQASSYDRHSISPDKPGWFANADASQYIRKEEKNGRSENVMLDVDGPGAIVRFWLTTFKRNGIIRIYFDGQDQPTIEIPAYDLMKSNLGLGKALLNPHSSYEPTEKGGSTLYLPLPYAKHCKITFEDHDIENKQPRYYQINYRTYSANTKVTTFSLDQLSSLRSLADETDKKLWNPISSTDGKEIKVSSTIKSQKQFLIDLPKGPSAVRVITITIQTSKQQDYAQALRSTILKITFDDHQTVWCPIGDFSGSGVGGKQIQSWYRTVGDDGKIISRWVMPYKRSAKISLMNLSSDDVDVSLTATVSDWKWDGTTMYFHSSWKQSRNVPIKKSEEERPIEWNFNTIEGKGVYAGNTLAVYNHMHKWYGEGDQKIWIDNEKFPSEFGTGTEDYYNTSWAPVVLYQTPFANAPRADNADSYGHNTFTRTRILDAVPFTKSFLMSLEMLGWENGEADFAVTTYWYAFEGASDNCKLGEKEAAVILY
ncbi:MAG: DUF2961 domain-containing protein [Bacteroidetes bacterium]|nr:DUF2961 domain-containing protein [Bacteroidota bacterium]